MLENPPPLPEGWANEEAVTSVMTTTCDINATANDLVNINYSLCNREKTSKLGYLLLLKFFFKKKTSNLKLEVYRKNAQFWLFSEQCKLLSNRHVTSTNFALQAHAIALLFAT